MLRSRMPLLFTLCYLASVAPLHASNILPNIIIILADDLGVGDLSMNGSPIRTPNIDSLARGGVYLSDFYASANVCTPSRAGLLTGRYPIRTGLADNVIESGSSHGLPTAEQTIAELLKEKDYRTMLVGKWHLGHSEQFWPTNHGFDEYYGLPFSNDMEGVGLYRGRELIEQPVIQETLTQRYTDAATDFIAKNSKRPFFVFMSHTFPHIPLHASNKFRGKSAAGIYGDAVEELDWSTGEIVAELKRLGIENNTLVFFTSDNGAWFEGSNAQFRSMKGMTWEGGFRVPLVAWWPDKIRPGTRTGAMAMNIDLLPTIAGLVDARPAANSEIDGKDIWPLLQGGEQSPHDVLYLFHNEDIAALRSQDWKYQARAYYRTRYIGFENIREKMGFEYELLFDMRGEQKQRYSQASNQPAILASMKNRLAEARETFAAFKTQPEMKVFP